MKWNWQQAGWPRFTYDSAALQPLEQQFLLLSGEFVGAFKHVQPADQDLLKIELIRDEAIKTSAIEGEILDRDSVQSSLRREFGLSTDNRKIPPAERGVAEMMAYLYRNFGNPLTHESLFSWHRMLMSGTRRLQAVGRYREHAEAMQVVSGPIHAQNVHFEGPPSSVMTAEMKAFVTWFNDTAPGGKRPLSAVTRAGIAHLYFVSIHPFEDGNGRIARAVSEKSLAQNLRKPSLIALAYTIERSRKAYSAALERNNKTAEITDWLVHFAETIVEAQRNTIRRVDFYVAKTKLYERLRGQLNERQERVLARMLREGIDGFTGGLSAEKYVRIAKTSRATATRDLRDLVAMGALTRTGELRHTRYALNLRERA